MHTVQYLASWIVGNGKNINFWRDKWLISPIVDTLGIPNNLHTSLNASIFEFINNGAWILLDELCSIAAGLIPEIGKIVNPISNNFC